MTGLPDRDPPKAIFFDLDGTIADSLDLMWQVFSKFLLDHGVTATRAMFEHYNGVPLKPMISELKRTHSIEASLDDLNEQYLAEVDSAYIDVMPHEGVETLLARLKANGCFLALVTSNGIVRVETWLVKHGLDEYFDGLVCAEDVSKGKPDAEPYQKALREFGGLADQAIVVEDAPLGAQAGLAAGIRTIAISNENNLFPDRVTVVSDFNALTKELGLDQA